MPSKPSICFFCHSPFHFWVFKNIAKELEKKATATWVVDDNFETTQKTLLFLKSQGISAQTSSQVPDFEQFDAIVLTNPQTRIFSLRKPKIIRAVYGFGKENWGFSAYNLGYDLVLCPGKYVENNLSKYCPCKIVGNPKFDGYKTSKLKPETLGLNPLKKTILYLPTYGSVSSVKKFSKAINDLGFEFNLIVKLHHGLSHQIQEYKIKFSKACVLDETTDLLPLLKAADLVLCDYGGAALDALLVKKPLVLLDIENEILQQANVNNRELIQKIRKIIPHTKNPSQLREKVIQTVSNPKKTRLDPKKYGLFFYVPKNASKLAAKAILQQIANKQKIPVFFKRSKKMIKELCTKNAELEELYKHFKNENKRLIALFEETTIKHKVKAFFAKSLSKILKKQ